jgi:hypothetical protein
MSIHKTKEEMDKLTPAEKQAAYTASKVDHNAMLSNVDTTYFLRRIGLVVFKR